MTGCNFMKLKLKTAGFFIPVILLLFLVSSPGLAAVYGDINEDGAINVQDVVMVMRHILDLELLDDDQLMLADVNNDGEVDVRDATLIMQKALAVIEQFPDLPDAPPGLIEEFISEEGLSPGKKFVIVLLDTDYPEEYKVSVGDTELVYYEEIGGFRGEVDEENAEFHRVKVETVND